MTGLAPTRVELLHETESTRVTRLALAGRTVIRKELLGRTRTPGFATNSRSSSGSAASTGSHSSRVSRRTRAPIVLEDAGHASLVELASPIGVEELIELSVRLSRAVAGMHGRGVMHRDIAPSNIVLSADGAPCLVDFALATSFAEIRPEFTHHSEIVGTLPYLAPEQTGRTGRPVDQRADLYALGATLYELATGEPPFGAGDPLRLIARSPRARAGRAGRAQPGAPGRALGDRHAPAREGARRPLPVGGGPAARPGARCGSRRQGPASASAITTSRRGCSRRRGWWAASRKLATLEEAFERALTGRCRACWSAGAPGIGKTALVNELRAAVTGYAGWFVAGKFDEHRRDLEADGVFQAFNALYRLLLAEPEDELAAVRERAVSALGPQRRPRDRALAGGGGAPAVAPDPGDPLTAQARAQRSSVDFLRAVASRERPVVCFVDDLQWAGRTPLGLFGLVLDEEPIEGLLLVGAYRDDGFDPAHPLVELSRSLARGRERSAAATRAPAAAEPCRAGRRDAACRLGRGGEPRRGDRTLRVGQSLRDRRGAQRPPPRRPADRHSGGVALGRRGDSRPSRRFRGRRAHRGARRGPAASVDRAAGRDGVPRRPRPAARAPHRHGRAGRGRRPPARAGARRRRCWSRSPGPTPPCASATTASARPSSTGWDSGAGAACSWRWPGGSRTCPSSSRSPPSSTCP